MKHFFKQTSLLVLSFALSSGTWAQRLLQPSESCRDHSASSIVSFADAVLETVSYTHLTLPTIYSV